MTRSSLSRTACAFIGAAVVFTASGVASAGPTSVAGASVAARSSDIVDVRYHGHGRRRSSGVPGAVLGLFGAALGAAVASDRYNNYSYQSYGYPNGYGYAPVYGGGPAYGYGQSGFGAPRGGFVTHMHRR